MKIEAISANGIIKGWRIVRLFDGAILAPFTTRREAEIIVDFFMEAK